MATIIMITFALAELFKRIIVQPEQPLPHKDGTQLLPAEFAYLSQPDDLLHTILVMVVDLMQRAVKSALLGSGPPTILDYELQLWTMTENFVKTSAKKATEAYLPNNIADNPIGYFRRISSLYATILNFIRHLFKDVTKDPRHIKKYFSATGLSRLVMDFFSSGYQDRIKEELLAHLTKKGLLLTNEKCTELSNLYFLLGIVSGLAGLVTVSISLPYPNNTIIAVLAIVSASIVSLTIFLREFIPLFPEMNELLRHLKRRDWRISLVRVCLGSLNIISWLIIAIMFIFTIVMSMLILRIATHSFIGNQIVILSTLLILLMISFSFIQHSLVLRSQNILSAFGEAKLKETRQHINQLSPSEVLMTMLQSDKYDPTFSEIVAMYGIAPLIILV